MSSTDRRRGARPTHHPRKWTDERVDRLEVLYCVEGRDYDDIAAVLETTPAAVKQQIGFRGLTLTPQAVAARRARGVGRGRRKKSEGGG